MNKEKLQNHKGRFTTLSVRRRNKVTNYCAQIKKITDKTISFKDMNSGELVTTYFENVL